MEEFIYEVENIIEETIESCIPHDWDEDFITRRLLSEFRNKLSKSEIHYPNFTKYVYWKSYKNTGKLEQNFGDIALLINVQFITGEVLKGVCFLEAKKQYDSGKFDAIDLKQLNRIKEKAPNSQLLLYSKKKDRYPSKLLCCEYFSYLRATPINTAQEFLPQLNPKNDLSLLRITQPFSYLLVSRFFWGLDLEYGEEAIKLALIGRDDFSPPKYLSIIDVYYEGQSPIQQEVSDLWSELVD